MKKRHLIGLAAACLAIFCMPVRPETGGTTLSLEARWDDRSDVDGTVIISAVHVMGSDTVLATKALSDGRASVTLPLTSNALYHVTVDSPAGAQIIKFPFTTALVVNPQNIQRGSMNLVLRKADHTIKSASINVSMNF
jgi:hypothetical protein